MAAVGKVPKAFTPGRGRSSLPVAAGPVLFTLYIFVRQPRPGALGDGARARRCSRSSCPASCSSLAWIFRTDPLLRRAGGVLARTAVPARRRRRRRRSSAGSSRSQGWAQGDARSTTLLVGIPAGIVIVAFSLLPRHDERIAPARDWRDPWITWRDGPRADRLRARARVYLFHRRRPTRQRRRRRLAGVLRRRDLRDRRGSSGSPRSRARATSCGSVGRGRAPTSRSRPARRSTTDLPGWPRPPAEGMRAYDARAASPTTLLDARGDHQALRRHHRAAAPSTSTSATARWSGLIGPNGAGKTTFFNCLLGMLRPEAGTVALRRARHRAATRLQAGPPRLRPHVPAARAVRGHDACATTSSSPSGRAAATGGSGRTS